MVARELLQVSEGLPRNKSLLRANEMQKTTREQRTSSTVKASASRHGCYDKVLSNWGVSCGIKLGLVKAKPSRYTQKAR